MTDFKFTDMDFGHTSGVEHISANFGDGQYSVNFRQCPEMGESVFIFNSHNCQQARFGKHNKAVVRKFMKEQHENHDWDAEARR